MRSLIAHGWETDTARSVIAPFQPSTYPIPVPTGLKRYQTQGHDHLITFSCYRRLPFLNDAAAKDTFERILEKTRSA